MTAANQPIFTIKNHRTKTSQECIDSVLQLNDQTEYVIELTAGNCFQEHNLNPEIFRPVNDTVGILNFGNYVGDAEFLGQRVRVVNRKITGKQFEQMLDSITKSIAELPFGYNSPTLKPFERSALRKKPVLYHDFVYLKELILRRAYGENLESLFQLIANNPHRLSALQYSHLPAAKVAAVSPRSLLHMFSDSDRLMKCQPSSALWGTAVGKALSKDGRDRYFPIEIYAERAVMTLDTPENRFIKHFIDQCRNIVVSFYDFLENDESRFEASAKQDCRQMLRTIDAIMAHALMQSVGQMQHLPIGSSILQKRAGYRQMYEHFCRLNMAPVYPIGSESLERLIDLKDVATLYECWAFFQVAHGLAKVLGKPVRASAADFNTKTVNLSYRASLEWPSDPPVRLFYNKSYSGNSPTSSSYSVLLRPDISLEIGDEKYLFDAKFKLDRLNQFVPESETAQQLDEEEAQEKQGSNFKKGDLYKMHTYRDAINDAVSIWILYPGEQFRFFSVNDGKVDHPEVLRSLDGVGAIPLRPGSGCGRLVAVLEHILETVGCWEKRKKGVRS